jgi:VCBS repeat-containing protein
MKKINGTGRADTLRGTASGDTVYAKKGDDFVYGLGGGDTLFGEEGNDLLDGGSGSDRVEGGEGDDLLVYVAAENAGAVDLYDGGTGRDTLRLVLTAAEWDREGVRQDVHRFLAHIQGRTDAPTFSFGSLGLGVTGVERLEVVVDGRAIDPADRAVTLAADAATLSEDDAAGVTLDLLANDLVADGVRSVTIAQPAGGSVEIVSLDLAGATPSAVVRFKPAGGFDGLAEGETTTEVFTYTVVDKDGDARTASVTVTVTGTNDRPVVQARTATMTAGGVASGDLSTTAFDAEGDALKFGGSFWSAPAGFDLDADGSWTFDPEDYQYWEGDQTARAVRALAEGETLDFKIDYYAYDPSYGYSDDATLTITVVGVNDAAILQNTLDYAYEDSTYDWTPVDGVSSKTGLLNVLDWDNDYGAATLTVVGGASGNLGTLIITGFDAEEGRYGYRYDIASDALAALEEGEEKLESFQIRIDDGQGSVTVQTFEIAIQGDGNDPVLIDYDYEEPVIDAGGVRSQTIVHGFEDYDYTDDHSATVAWIGEGAVGTIKAEVIDEDGDYYLLVTWETPIDLLGATGPDDLFQSFRVTLTDNAGSTVVREREVRLYAETWQIGEAANDVLYGYDNPENRDVLIGGEGADLLLGGAGSDHLYGGDGPALPDSEYNDYWLWEWEPVAGFDDELDGGRGADLLTGGAGADRFVFWAGEANGDVVVDFEAGDKIEFIGYGDGAEFTRIDATTWRIASEDGELVEVITFQNAPDLQPGDLLFA